MKIKILVVLCFMLLIVQPVFADTQLASIPMVSPDTDITTTEGFSPAIVGSLGAFYLNGKYKLFSAGINFGTNYTFKADKNANVSSLGILVGPQSSLENGSSVTVINVMLYLDLFKTAKAGSWGIGIGDEIWKSAVGFQKPTAGTTFMVLGYKF